MLLEKHSQRTTCRAIIGYYKWHNTQEMGEAEPKYICIGVRDIAEAPQAAAEFDCWIRGR